MYLSLSSSFHSVFQPGCSRPTFRASVHVYHMQLHLIFLLEWDNSKAYLDRTSVSHCYSKTATSIQVFH
jgi:hypothetical protein